MEKVQTHFGTKASVNLTSEHAQETEGKALKTLVGLFDAGCHSSTQGML